MKKKSLALFLMAAVWFFVGACGSQHERTAAGGQYKEVASSEEANQLVEQGWVVMGYNKYADANGHPQGSYLLRKPKK